MRRFTFSMLSVFVVLSGGLDARAAVVMTATEVGGDVVVTGGGTLNTAGLLSSGTITPLPGITPNEPTLILGAGVSGDVTVDVYSSITAPADFGSGGFTGRDSGTGSAFGVGSTIPVDLLLVPEGYVSGTPVAATNTYQGASFASLGIDPGTYVWTWGTGANADSFTLEVVPEPGAGLVLAALGLTRRKRSGA